MENTTKVQSLKPAQMALIFSQGHRAAKKLEILQSFCYKVSVHEAAITSAMVDYVREMTAKRNCKCCDYESFENMLLAFVIRLCFDSIRKREN